MNEKPGPKRPSALASPEMITALAAVVIGACALVVAFVEVRIVRADQRAVEACRPGADSFTQ